MVIENKSFDEERALYNLKNSEVINCIFAGPADGESAFKEAKNINVTGCNFSLRYPFWHVDNFRIENCRMDSLTRAAIWYSENGTVSNSKLGGIKALRECIKIKLNNCQIISPEFGWKCDDIIMTNSYVESEYLFLDSNNIKLNNVRMKGKYSFQYVNNLKISDSEFDTKDAFWHAKNTTVKDSIIKGEYLGWYSENLTLINCKIIGTQPLCYCEGLKLINCTMENADLSFEYSDVNADIKGEIISVKNPKSGEIIADNIGEIITENAVIECNGKVTVRH